jgi:hypothetical protein
VNKEVAGVKNRIIIYLLLLPGLIILAAGCSSIRELSPTEIITTPTNTPIPLTNPDLLGTSDCRPPCWHGIIPGVTTFDEALAIVDQEFSSDPDAEIFYDIVEDVLFLGNTNTDDITIMGQDYLWVSIYFWDDVAAFIKLWSVDVELGAIINHWGEPDSYNMRFVDTYHMWVYYEEYVLVFSMTLYEGDDPFVSDETSVDHAMFIAPQYFPEYTDDPYAPLREWGGYEGVRIP